MVRLHLEGSREGIRNRSQVSGSSVQGKYSAHRIEDLWFEFCGKFCAISLLLENAILDKVVEAKG